NPYQPNDIFVDNKPKFNNKNIVAVGRFTYKKAPHLSILAFQKVIKNNPEAKLFMVGDGILFESCVNLVKALKIEKSVHFLGVLKTCEIKSLFQKSSIFIQHSVTPISGDQEGSPVAILEASAAGLPIVSTKHSGIMQSVINAKTGFLVDEFDIYSMSERINMLLNDRNMAKKYGDNARKHIRENYLSHFITIENYIKDKIL
ncbi:MAG: glycosyltransferase, partial [bacterium]